MKMSVGYKLVSQAAQDDSIFVELESMDDLQEVRLKE